MKNILTGIGGIVCALVLSAVFASSAQALSMTTKIELSGDPGHVATGEILVYNDQKTASTYYFSTANFEADGESGTPNFTDSKEGLATWIQAPEKIVLAAGEQVRVPIVVSIPASARPGGYFAAVFLSTSPSQSTGGGEVSIGFKVGTLVLLRVNGFVDVKGGVFDFGTTTGNHFFTALPVGFSYRFQNSGGDRIVPDGSITVRNMIGIVSKKLLANPTSGNVLPMGSVRKFDIVWDTQESTVLTDVFTKPQGFFAHVRHEWNHFAFGIYHAKLLVTYGENNTASAGTFVFVFPWHLLLVCIIVGGGLLFVLRIALRRYNRWIIAQARRAITEEIKGKQ